MTTELIDLGRCPTCNQPRWLERMCECGHGMSGHDLNRRKERTACSHFGCGCKIFAEVSA